MCLFTQKSQIPLSKTQRKKSYPRRTPFLKIENCPTPRDSNPDTQGSLTPRDSFSDTEGSLTPGDFYPDRGEFDPEGFLSRRRGSMTLEGSHKGPRCRSSRTPFSGSNHLQPWTDPVVGPLRTPESEDLDREGVRFVVEQMSHERE